MNINGARSFANHLEVIDQLLEQCSFIKKNLSTTA